MRILLSKEYSRLKELVFFVISYRKIIDYSLLFLMILPNLIWILLDRGMWVSDTSLYGLSAIKLNYALVHNTVDWWKEMLSVVPKPPILPWTGQFFVPLGRFIGNINSGLLLIIFLAQYGTLFLLYKALMKYFKKRSFALIGCLVVASASLFIGISRQFYVQSVQLAAVVWFIYIMAYSKKWNSITVILQLVAASSFAMLIMLSSPVFCILPGIVSLYQILKKGKSGLEFRKKHVYFLVVVLVLLVPTLSWYLRNFYEAITYARWGYNYLFGGIVTDVFLLKLAVWGSFIPRGFLLSPILVLAIFVWVLLNRLKGRGSPKNNNGIIILLVFLQIILVLALFATSAHQTMRYVLPLLGYFALIVSWGLFQINKRWFTSVVLTIFTFQLILVNLNDFGLINTKIVYGSIRPLQMSRDRNFDLMEIITKIASNGDSTKTIVLATGGIGFYNLNLEFYASKSPEYFSRERRHYDSVEFMLTGSPVEGEVGRDIEKVWNQILASQPGYIVILNKENRLSQLDSFEGGWGRIINSAIEISERVAESRLFKKVSLPEYQEIEIYWQVRGDG